MSVMLSELYRALLEHPPTEEQARKAAEEVAAYDARLHRVESDLSQLKWMVATNIVLTIAVLGRLLFVS
jgi:hypothetical protein